MRILICILLSVILALVLYCDPTCSRHEGGAEYRALAGISESGNSQMIRGFEQYDVNKRIDIFLYAVHCRKDDRFEPILAKAGKEIIPDVVRRIEKENRAWDKYQLVQVLIRINADCRCIEEDSPDIKRLETVGQQLAADNFSSPDDTYNRIYSEAVLTLKKQLQPN